MGPRSARAAPWGTLSSSTMMVMRIAITPSLKASSRVLLNRDLPHHHPVSLKVLSKNVWLRTRFSITEFLVEAYGAGIMLPHTEADRTPAHTARFAVAAVHHRHRDPLPLPVLF